MAGKTVIRASTEVGVGVGVGGVRWGTIFPGDLWWRKMRFWVPSITLQAREGVHGQVVEVSEVGGGQFISSYTSTFMSPGVHPGALHALIFHLH